MNIGMNIEERYERTLKRSEVVLAVDEYDINSDYQERMLLENDIAGILSMKVEYKNGKKEYRYEISNKINLKTIGSMENISYGFLKDFLMQISSNFEVLDRYMLEEDKLLFDPEHIFFDKDTKKLFLLFFPAKKEDKNDFILLTEHLITIIDQTDELAVWTAYVLEKDAKMENFSLLAFLVSMMEHEEELKKEDEFEIEKKEVTEGPSEVKEKNPAEYIPVTGYVRVGIGFGLAAVYFVAGNLIAGKYAFEYTKSMILLGILIAITIGAILFTIYEMIKERDKEGS